MSLTESVEKRGIGLNLTKQCCSGDKFTLKKLYSQVNQVPTRIVVLNKSSEWGRPQTRVVPWIDESWNILFFKSWCNKAHEKPTNVNVKYSKCCSFCELSINLWISLNAIFQIQSFILTFFWNVWASMFFILRHRKFKLIR